MVDMSSRWKDNTLADYLEYWLKSYCEKRLARNTVNGYRTNINKHITPYIGQILLFELQPSDVEVLYDHLLDTGLSGTTVLYVHAVLRKALNTAVKRRVLDCNVLNYLDAPVKSQYRPTVLTADNVSLLLNACKGREIYLAVLLSLTLGLRRGEVLGLKWGDIDWKLKTVEVSRSATFYRNEFVLSTTKTKNSNRTLIVADSVLIALSRCKRGLDDLIVCRTDGNLMTSSYLDKNFQDTLKAARLPYMRFHDLRHTNATLMLKQNIPAKIVSAILGHSSVGITLDIYSHVLTEMQRPAADVMESLLLAHMQAI